MEDNYVSQKKLVRNHLLSGRSITPLLALTLFGAMRLSAIIFELRHDEGMDIRTEIMRNGRKNWAEYSLIS